MDEKQENQALVDFEVPHIWTLPGKKARDPMIEMSSIDTKWSLGFCNLVIKVCVNIEQCIVQQVREDVV